MISVHQSQRLSEAHTIIPPLASGQSEPRSPCPSSGFHSSNSALRIPTTRSFASEDASLPDSILIRERVKRPAESPISMLMTSDKRTLSEDLPMFLPSLSSLEVELQQKEDVIATLQKSLEASRTAMETSKREHVKERKRLREDVERLKYENMQLKVHNEDARLHIASQGDRVPHLEAEVQVLKSKLIQKDQENFRLQQKIEKLNDDYIRLSEDIIMDPAENFPVHGVDCTFRPITPQEDEHECINPRYSENGTISNQSIAQTATEFCSKFSNERPELTKLDEFIGTVAAELEKKTTTSPQASTWFAKKSKKQSKWNEVGSLPDTQIDQCAAAEHCGRLYVAGTVASSHSTSRSPTPTPSVVLYVYNEKDHRFVNFNVCPPPEAAHPTGLFSYRGILYMVTAQSGGDSIWRLDSHMKQWTFLCATYSGETSCATCMVDEHIILAGGARKDGLDTSLKTVKSFSVKDMSWNLGWPQMIVPRLAARIVLYENTLCVFGGGGGSKLAGFDAMDVVERLDLRNITAGWCKAGRTDWYATALISTGNSIVKAGGVCKQSTDMTVLSSCSTISLTNRGIEYKELPRINVRRSTSSLVSFNNHLYCIGGCTEKSFCAVVEELVQE